MMIAGKGQKVRVHYTGTLDDGSVFDSSTLHKRPPLEFTVGAGQMIPGFDKGVEGMAVGETKKLVLEPVDAYGERREELVIKVPRVRLPQGYIPKVGDRLQMGHNPVKIIGIESESVVLDANHELAGQRLNFEVTLVEIL